MKPDSPIEMLNLERKLFDVFSERCKPIIKRYRLNQSCLAALMFFADNSENNTARDLQNVRGYKSGIISVSISTLVDRGFLVSEEDSSDRRVKRLTTTPLAEPVITEVRAVYDVFEKKLMEGVSEGEMDEYCRINRKFMENLDKLRKEVL